MHTAVLAARTLTSPPLVLHKHSRPVRGRTLPLAALPGRSGAQLPR